MPILTDKTIKLLRTGLLYIHGRAKDFSPIMVLDVSMIASLFASRSIDEDSFCQLHNFVANYCKNNMMVAGQSDQWMSIVNIANLPLSGFPVSMFKACVQELQMNYAELNKKAFVVNASWFMMAIVRVLQSFMDEHSVSK